MYHNRYWENKRKWATETTVLVSKTIFLLLASFLFFSFLLFIFFSFLFFSFLLFSFLLFSFLFFSSPLVSSPFLSSPLLSSRSISSAFLFNSFLFPLPSSPLCSSTPISWGTCHYRSADWRGEAISLRAVSSQDDHATILLLGQHATTKTKKKQKELNFYKCKSIFPSFNSFSLTLLFSYISSSCVPCSHTHTHYLTHNLSPGGSICECCHQRLHGWGRTEGLCGGRNNGWTNM